MGLTLKIQNWYAKKQSAKILSILTNSDIEDISETVKAQIKSKYMDDYWIVGQALFKGIIKLTDVSDRFKKDINIVRYALKHDGTQLRDADEKFQNDIELIKLIVTYNTNVLAYAGQNILNNKDFFLECIKRQPRIAIYLSRPLMKDLEFIKILLSVNLQAYSHMYGEIKQNKQLALDILKKDFKLIKEMTNEFQKDTDILLTASYYARNEEPKGYPAPFYHNYVIDSPEACYMYENRYDIDEDTFPVVKQALLENPTAIINPPESIKMLIENMEDQFLVLAHYALGQNMTIATDVQLPDDLLL